MDIFSLLLLKLVPFYIIILLGFIGGKYLHIKKESIAQILFYFIAPVVIFNGIVTTNLLPSVLSLPLLFFFISCVVSLLIYFITGYIWKDQTRNILAFTAGSANTGYFGLPVAVAIFGTYVAGIAALVMLGTALFVNTIRFILAGKGQHTPAEKVLKMLKLPILYAFIVGVAINMTGIQLAEAFIDTAEYFNGAFSVLGMFLIGLTIAEVTKLQFDFKYNGFSIFAKFLLWPLIMLGIIYLDSHYFKIYDSQLYNIFLLMSVVPVATNIVSYTASVKIPPEKASIDILISTLIALFFIPLAAVFLL